MTFTIEKNIPTPTSGYKNRKYPFPEMKIGDSFSLEYEAAHLVGAASRAWGRKHGAKFTTRKNGNGYRIWRIA